MKKNMNLLIMLIFFSFLFSCSEGLKELNTSQAIPKGSLLVIDEANQILNAVNPKNGSVVQVSYVGNSANDIKVDGDYAYILASLNNTIFKIDLLKGGYIRTLSLIQNFGEAPNPYNQTIDNLNIYVTLSVSNKIIVLSKSSFTISSTIILPSPGYPEGITIDDNNIYTVSGYLNNKLLILDKVSYNLITNIEILTNPQSLIKDNNGNVWVACTGKYNTSDYKYDKGGLIKISYTGGSYITNVINDKGSFFVVKADNDKIYALDSIWGRELSGLNIYNSSGLKITNLLQSIDLKGITYDDNNIYVSEAYGGNKVYIINKTNYSISIINNTGGGDMSIYR